MRFHLIDRIDDWDAGKSLRAKKFLALGEEYLADHFPGFPVMPGVLMLQAVVEAAAWLWRVTTDYQHPVIVLRDVRNVKYGTFMQPGRRMDVVVDLTKHDGDTATFKGQGHERGRGAGRQSVPRCSPLHGYSHWGPCSGRRPPPMRETGPALERSGGRYSRAGWHRNQIRPTV